MCRVIKLEEKQSKLLYCARSHRSSLAGSVVSSPWPITEVCLFCHYTSCDRLGVELPSDKLEEGEWRERLTEIFL